MAIAPALLPELLGILRRCAAPAALAFAAAARMCPAAAATARFISAGFAAMCAFCIYLSAPHVTQCCCSDEYGAALQRKALSILHTVLEVLQASAALPLHVLSCWWAADESSGGAARRPPRTPFWSSCPAVFPACVSTHHQCLPTRRSLPAAPPCQR